MSVTSTVADPAGRPDRAPRPARPLRLGFLGTGWIGRSRMASLLEHGHARAVVIAEPDPEMGAEAARLAPEATVVASLEALLSHAGELDGVVIATPSALHAEQAIAALETGLAVCCQKPLARDLAETSRVLAAAERLGRPLGIDLSYRHAAAVTVMLGQVRSGAIGTPVAVDLVFDNAYGPDKPWFRDRRRSGGGCVIDLGVHLLDLALSLAGARELAVRDAELRVGGRRLDLGDETEVEDFAWASLRTDTGVPVRLGCSWFGPAGRDCRIAVTVTGTDGALALANVDGSFYDLSLERRHGTRAETLVQPPDAWGGRAVVAWADALADGAGFDGAEAERIAAVAAAVDAIYAEGGRCAS